MKKLGIFVAGAIVFSSAAHAYDYKVGALEIDHPWSRAVPKGATVAGLQLPVHTEPPVEFAGESEDTGGRKRDFESHLPFRGDVLVDAEGRDAQVVQRPRLALHEQRELLPRLAAEKGR